MRMIGMLLFIAVANLAVSVFLDPPKEYNGKYYISRYTNLSFKLTMIFALLALLF